MFSREKISIQREKNLKYISKYREEISKDIDNMIERKIRVHSELYSRFVDGSIIFLLKDKKKNLKTNNNNLENPPKIIERKTPRHEALVSLYGTNKLRKQIPNFLYCYGYIKDKALIVENNEGVSFTEFLRNCSIEEFTEQYLQVLHALKIANESIGFTHYNLTTNNVIVVDNDGDIRYDNITMSVDKYPLIVNFNHSRFSIDDRSCGNENIEDTVNFIHHETDHILHDVYNFTIHCYKYADSMLKDTIGKLLSFFLEDYDEIDYNRDIYLPMSEHMIYDYIIYANKVLNYDYSNLHEYHEESINEEDTIEDTLDLYDYKIRNNRGKLKELLKSIDYESLRHKAIQSIDKSIEELNAVKVIDLEHAFPFTGDNFFTHIRDGYYSIFYRCNIIDDILNLINTASFCAYLYLDRDLMGVLENILKFIDTKNSELSKHIQNAHKTYIGISKWKNTNDRWFNSHSNDIIYYVDRDSTEIYRKIINRVKKLNEKLSSADFPIIVDVINNNHYRVI